MTQAQRAFDYSSTRLQPANAAQPSAKTCRIVRLPNPRRVIEDHSAAEIAARLLQVAFGGRSENAICELTRQRLGFSENTVRSILRRNTVRVDARILLQSAVYCMSIGVDPMEVAGVKQLYQKYCGRAQEKR